jgi:hypothetical protein
MLNVLTSRATQSPIAKPIIIKIQTLQEIIRDKEMKNTYRKQHMAFGDSVILVLTVALQWKRAIVIGLGP